ncbi:MAG: hypothetical protein ACXV5Q_04545 [Frankiaceae bacterium]
MAQYLAERGLPVPEDDLVTALDGMLGDRLARPGSAPLPPAAQAFLAAHAGMVKPAAQAASRAAADAAAAVVVLVETTLTVEEAAQRLGCARQPGPAPASRRVADRAADGPAPWAHTCSTGTGSVTTGREPTAGSTRTRRRPDRANRKA